MADHINHDLDEPLALMTRAAEEALSHWDGAFQNLALVKYRENAVYSVHNEAGKRFALRVHRLGYHSDAELLSELQWMSALASSGISVPGIVPARDGSLFVKVALPDARPLQVDILEWLTGEPIGSIEDLSSCSAEDLQLAYFKVGELAARIHNFGETWTAPNGFVRHAWDTQGLIGQDPFWGRFRDLPALKKHLKLIDAACAKAETELARLGRSPAVYGMIHADFVPENLLEADSRIRLIDFDDAGFGWHLFELATALYFHLDTPHYDVVFSALLTGYWSVRHLSEDHVAMLPLFLLLRSITYLSWVQTRRETTTAMELTPMFVERTIRLAENYLLQA